MIFVKNEHQRLFSDVRGFWIRVLEGAAGPEGSDSAISGRVGRAGRCAGDGASLDGRAAVSPTETWVPASEMRSHRTKLRIPSSSRI